MWYEISSVKEVNDFMEKINFFHDSCIKELKYSSGAYVNDKYEMYPVNDRRILNVVFQCQREGNGMFEMEFQGLRYLKLLPLDEMYTCEILDATMFIQKGLIYWYDCGGLSEEDLNDYTGTVICASKLRWRPIFNRMGDQEFYIGEGENL